MFKLIALSTAFVGVVSALTVNTPASLVQCQPALLSWSDGTGPYYLAIIPGGQPSAAALENLPTQQGTSYTWTVDLAAGQSVTVKITDSTGAINYSDKVTIQAGTSASCGAGSSSGSSAAGSAAGGASSASSAARTSLATSMATAAASSSSSAAPATLQKTTTSATSGIGAAGAAATGMSTGSSSTASTTSTKTGGATTLKAATGLVAGALIFALAA